MLNAFATISQPLSLIPSGYELLAFVVLVPGLVALYIGIEMLVKNPESKR